MRAHDRQSIKALVTWFLFSIAQQGAADPGAITGTWTLDEDASGNLNKEVNRLKQEYREYKSEHGTINDPDKPDPFTSSRKFGEKEWESRRSGPVGNASINVRKMVNAEMIKLYISDRFIVVYDGKLKRLISPNPNGRVHSATGKGISKDAVGETLAYVDNDAVVIETRTTSAERMAERFEVTSDDRLKVTTELHNPDWRREVEFVRLYDRKVQ